MRIFAVAILLSLSWGCSKINSRSAKVNYYFSIDSLISSQQQYLDSLRPALKKIADVNGDSSIKLLTSDSILWKNELDIFRNADINKPIYKDLYEYKTFDDKTSNLSILSYIPKDVTSTDVTYLNIYYLDKLSDIKRVEAEYIENNPIYRSKKHIDLDFTDIGGVSVLQGYQISGVQKMILKDTVLFNMNAEVQF